MLFFAFSTIIGWYFFGEQNVKALFGHKAVKAYAAIVVVCIVIGSALHVDLVWNLSDLFNQNFKDLANDGFYDGLTFHRIITGFMMQGGDPLGNGTGGSENTIKGEFSENGVENKLSHTRGAVSMARSSDPDSASSQFFIVQQDSTYLDGQYACFGYVTKGMDVVDEICDNTPVEDDNGTVKTEKSAGY